MKFRDYFSIKQILLTIVVLALFILLALWDSNTQVKVTFRADSVLVDSDKYDLTIPYSDVANAELTDLAEAGVELENGSDDQTMRTGLWKNDTWGEYYICADLEADNCIVSHLNDGRIFVFSGKNTKETEDLFAQYQSYLQQNK